MCRLTGFVLALCQEFKEGREKNNSKIMEGGKDKGSEKQSEGRWKEENYVKNTS